MPNILWILDLKKITSSVLDHGHKKIERPPVAIPDEFDKDFECVKFECVSNKVLIPIPGKEPEPCLPVSCPEGYDVEYDLISLRKRTYGACPMWV